MNLTHPRGTHLVGVWSHNPHNPEFITCGRADLVQRIRHVGRLAYFRTGDIHSSWRYEIVLGMIELKPLLATLRRQVAKMFRRNGFSVAEHELRYNKRPRAKRVAWLEVDVPNDRMLIQLKHRVRVPRPVAVLDGALSIQSNDMYTAEAYASNCCEPHLLQA